MYLLFFLAILMLPTLAACTQQPGYAPVMIANPLLVEENAHFVAATPETTHFVKAKQTVSSDKGQFYWVKSGDNLSSIAKAAALDPKQLAQWNRLSPPYQIRVGQKLSLSAPTQLPDRNPETNNSTVKTSVAQTKQNSVTDKNQPAETKEAGTPPVKILTPTTDKIVASNKNPIVKITALPEKKLGIPQPLIASDPGKSLVTPIPAVKSLPADSKTITATKSTDGKTLVANQGAVKKISANEQKKPDISINKNTVIKITALPEKKPSAPPPLIANDSGKPLITPIPAVKSLSADSKPLAVSTAQQAKKSNQKPQLPLSADRDGKPVTTAKSTDGKTLAANQGTAKKISVNEQKKPGISIDNKKMLKLNFQWPVKGALAKDFSKAHSKGIDIAVKGEKQAVNAAEAGKVVYQGQGLAGFKNLIIIKHNDDYLSAYANNSRLLVKEGQQVSKGQAIAEIGVAGSQQKPLHFEIRKNGTPLNPLDFLPK